MAEAVSFSAAAAFGADAAVELAGAGVAGAPGGWEAQAASISVPRPTETPRTAFLKSMNRYLFEFKFNARA
jgi:hypothetical protein